MWASLVAIFQGLRAIPEIINEIKNLISYIQKIQLEERLDRLDKALAPLEAGPTTTEEKEHAAEVISHTIHGK